MIRLRGLNWGHRRATGPMAAATRAFAAERPEVAIDWTIRPLSDFEHQPIAAVAAAFDLVILDHPFCGDIAASGAFRPLETAFPERLGPDADPLYVGPSLASYRYGGHLWAAPVDAATAHGCFRPDLLDAPPPASWDEALALGARLRRKGRHLALPVPTPHAFAAAASLMANLGRPIAAEPGVPVAVDRAALGTALDALAALLAFCPPESIGWNSIALHEAMQARDDVTFCPCVYGYAAHAEAGAALRLAFSNFCGLVAPHAAGSMLGGTGLAVSASAAEPEAALAFVGFCLRDEVQRDVFAWHHGQPALAAAWDDPENDRIFNGYFSGVRRSIETAWVRPRRPGYIGFQREAGIAVERHLRGDVDRRATVDAILERAARLSEAGAA